MGVATTSVLCRKERLRFVIVASRVHVMAGTVYEVVTKGLDMM